MKKILMWSALTISLLVVVAIAVILYGYSQLQAVNPEDDIVRSFTIARGEPIAEIAEKLESKGLIKNAFIFKIYSKLSTKDQNIQAGYFELSRAMSVAEVVTALTKGSDDIWITIPEGWRREEIAASLAEQDLSKFDEEEFLDLTQDLEGKLFPDSYLVSRQIATQDIMDLLHQTFTEKVINEHQAEIESVLEEHPSLSVDDLLVIASIIEREAKGQQQMKQVAGVIWNRIDINKPLEVDATLQYIKGYSETYDKWWQMVYAQDKEIESPYNTYKNAFLPPQPICNPGLDAFLAVLNPVESDYFFYLHDPQGEIHFAKTYQQHQVNINRYLK